MFGKSLRLIELAGSKKNKKHLHRSFLFFLYQNKSSESKLSIFFASEKQKIQSNSHYYFQLSFVSEKNKKH